MGAIIDTDVEIKNKSSMSGKTKLLLRIRQTFWLPSFLRRYIGTSLLKNPLILVASQFNYPQHNITTFNLFIHHLVFQKELFWICLNNVNGTHRPTSYSWKRSFLIWLFFEIQIKLTSYFFLNLCASTVLCKIFGVMIMYKNDIHAYIMKK